MAYTFGRTKSNTGKLSAEKAPMPPDGRVEANFRVALIALHAVGQRGHPQVIEVVVHTIIGASRPVRIDVGFVANVQRHGAALNGSAYLA